MGSPCGFSAQPARTRLSHNKFPFDLLVCFDQQASRKFWKSLSRENQTSSAPAAIFLSCGAFCWFLGLTNVGFAEPWDTQAKDIIKTHDAAVNQLRQQNVASAEILGLAEQRNERSRGLTIEMEEAIQILEGAKKTLGPESPIHGFHGQLYLYYLNQTTRLTVSYGPSFKFAGSSSKKASLFPNTRFLG